MICETCKLSSVSSTALFPIGSLNPEFYVLGDISHQDEIQNRQLFITSVQSNQYLLNTLNSLDLTLDNTRLFKLVRCCPETYDEEDMLQYRTDCSQYSLIDIFKTKPKLIISLGSEVTRILLKGKFRSISNSRGRLYDVELFGETFKVMPTYSPNYVINNPSVSDQFIKDILHAKSYVKGDLVDISAKDLRWATTYEEFKSYYDEKLVNSKMPSYDLETNAYDPRSNMARMVGFSLAPDTTTGIYIVRNSLEYKMPEEDWNKIVEITKQYLMSKIALVHNIMYEGPFTLNEWKINILDRFEDTLIKARMLRGGDLGGAGLKDQCILNLGYPDWDSDLDNYRSSFTNLLKLLKPSGVRKKTKWEYEFIRDRGLCALIDEIASYDTEEYYNGVDKYGKPKLSRLGKFNYYLNLCRDTLLKYYETDADYSIIMELVGDEICNLVDIDYDGPFSYGFIPMKLIRKYGAMDAVGTQDLNLYLENQMDKLSKELDIDLHKGYHYLKTQFIAGVQMELNGLYWNDDLANKAEEWYLDMCYKSLLYLIDTPYLDNFLFNKKKWMFNDFIVENQMDYVRQVLGDFTIKKTQINLSDGTKVKMGDIVSKMSEKLGYDLYEANKELVLKIIRDNAHKCEDMWGLKEFYNPNSTIKSHKELVSNILVTNNIKIAHLMNRLNVMLDDPDFDIYKYPPSDRKLFEILLECRKYNKAVEEFNAKLDSDEYDDEILEEMNEFAEFESVEDESDEDYEDSSAPHRKIKLSDKDTFDKFVQVLQSVQVQSNQIQQLVGDSLNYKLESLSEDWIIEIHKYYLITGIDLDDESTWNDEFKYLFNFRIFKKCNKLRSTYIVGKKVGRGQVWMVNKDDLQSGELLTRRRRKYDGNIGDNEACLMQGTYAVCSAETLRWRCLHGDTIIPLMDGTKSKIKDLVGRDKFYVYSYDYELGRIVPGLAYNVHQSYASADCYKVTFDNSESIICTGNHPFLTRKGQYIRADKLKPGISIMPLYRRESKKHGLGEGYEEVYHPQIGEWELTQYSSYRTKSLSNPCMKGHQIHHKDLNKRNNDPRNLVRITEKKHFWYHSQKSKGWKTIWNNEKNRKAHIEQAREQMISNNSSEEYQRKCTEGSHKFWSDWSRSFEAHITQSLNAEKTKIAKAYTAINFMINLAKQLNCDITKEVYNSHRSGRLIKWDTVMKNLELEEDYEITHFVNYKVFNNHKVVSVEYCGKYPVYDMTVEKYHNFAVELPDGTGVFTHNTGMHTIPAGSDIKKFYTSRYKGGVIFAPDFSQMEIRVMSGAANCTPMIEAFKQGADIHLMTAAKIFQKPPEEILPAERRYSKMASFQIIYGGDYHSFANEYLDGNEKLAKEIFDSFYSEFPEVRTWIEARHEQMRQKGLVTTPMDYFIRISPEKFHGDVNKALRAAQNYPIQSAGSSMAGNVVYELIKYFNENLMKSKIELFVHDSIEVDTPPEEFLRVALQIVPLMNKYPMDEFGIPTKADLVVGPSIGQEIELSEIEVNEDFTEGTMICDGYEEDFDQMIEGFKDVYEICEWEDLEEPKPVRVSWKELFIPKKCINKLYGQFHNHIKRKLHVKYTQDMIDELHKREQLVKESKH